MRRMFHILGILQDGICNDKVLLGGVRGAGWYWCLHEGILCELPSHYSCRKLYYLDHKLQHCVYVYNHDKPVVLLIEKFHHNTRRKLLEENCV